MVSNGKHAYMSATYFREIPFCAVLDNPMMRVRTDHFRTKESCLLVLQELERFICMRTVDVRLCHNGE